ncbi:MAG: 2-keto-4-pentenoate hydratase [Candidatus Kryptonium sp.]
MGNYVETFANELYQAELSLKPIEPLTSRDGNITIEDAYKIQLKNVKRKLETGLKIKGKKIGITSFAVQRMLNVNQPDFGYLFDTMYVEDGGVVKLDSLIQPRVEGEIAFVMEKDLKGPEVTVADVLKATAFVVPSIEIVDSRIKDWRIKIQDTIADNASSGLFVLGGKKTIVDNLDFRCLGMILEQNGEVVVSGAGAASLGNPVKAVAWLANKLAEFGEYLRAGEVVLSGALAQLVVPKKGDFFKVSIQKLGSVSVKFE